MNYLALDVQIFMKEQSIFGLILAFAIFSRCSVLKLYFQKMSGTLFIVCIPTSDKEKKSKDNDIKKILNRSPKSVIEKTTSEFVPGIHKVGFLIF